jgi:hypothetical protein
VFGGDPRVVSPPSQIPSFSRDLTRGPNFFLHRATAAKGGESGPSGKVDRALVRSLVRHRRIDSDDATLRCAHGFDGYLQFHDNAALMERRGSHDFR